MTGASRVAAVHSPPGVDETRLRHHLEKPLGRRLRDRFEIVALEGGHSNLTYRVTGNGVSWVLRRPPLGHVMATAHDMTREHTLLSGLAKSALPVPTPRHLCEDPDVIGAPFLVMDFVDGASYRWATQLEPLGPQRTRQISERLIDTLATLHDVRPDEVGLGRIGRPDGFLERQVRRWTKQLEASRSRDLAGAEELIAGLSRRQPTSGPPAIVHGDYRLDNLLIDRDDDQVKAVIDWEMATLGDPLTDLALLLTYQELNQIDPNRPVEAPLADGFLSPADQIARYADRSGTDLSDFGFYLALAHFKLAVIVESVHFRNLSGHAAREDVEQVGHLVEPLLAAGLAALKGE